MPWIDAITDQADNSGEPSVPIHLVTTKSFTDWHANQNNAIQTWLQATAFTAKPGEISLLPAPDGELQGVAVGWSGSENLGVLGKLPTALPKGNYHLAENQSDLLVLGWALGAYQFTRYRTAKREPATLVLKQDQARRTQVAGSATYITRDLINTPAADMLPTQLAAYADQLAQRYGARCDVTVGESLLDKGYRTIHAVGRASQDQPRLIDIRWGNSDKPKVTLVGKGVCFDSGGLNIKSAGGMRHMKKDMGGAAQVLGLAQMIMANRMPVNLRVLIPAVENAISDNAYRPGDVITTYQGITVEIENTDAEGRLVLCDALTLANEDKPELIIDFATLTGAARVAVGTELAAMFSNDNGVASAVQAAGEKNDDPVWQLPLHKPYNQMLNSSVADTVNSVSSPYAGASTAALFLKKFVGDTPWLHFDVMAFNLRNRPGRPEGGEAMGIRATYDYLNERFGDSET